MKKIKLHLFALCATLVLVSCGGSDNDPVFNNTSAVFITIEQPKLIRNIRV